MTVNALFKILTWEFLNTRVLQIKKKRKYFFSEKYAVLNVGCGLENPPNSLGLDGGIYVLYRFLPKFLLKKMYNASNNSKNYSFETFVHKIRKSDIIHHDLNYGLPFSDDSVPCIFNSHFLEHLYYSKAEYFLTECHRILKPNGVVRICIPSLDEEVNTIKQALVEYEKGNVTPIQQYVTDNVVGYKDPYSSHKYMYNFYELKKILAKVGFENITQSSFAHSMVSNFQNLDTRNGLIVEAVKKN